MPQMDSTIPAVRIQGEMGNWCGKLFSRQRINGKLIKELFDIVAKWLPVWISMVAEKDFFANQNAKIVVVAIIVFFLLMIFNTVISDESERTIATLIPITFIYIIACVVSSRAVIIISTLPIAVLNLVLWGTVYIVTVVIYCQKEFQSLDVAKDGSELPLISIITMNGDGNAPEQRVSGSVEELEQFREDDGDSS